MEKHTKLINFIKGLVIVAIAAVILIGLSKILLLKSEDGINQMQAFYKQPENSIDVIFLGSSRIYCDIATGVLWDNYGIAAYDLGGAEAPSWVSYYQLKEALRTQRPKVICYEISSVTRVEMLTQANNWASDNNYGMKWGSNRIDQLKVNSTEEEFYQRLNPFNIMHGRYKDLTENDFRNARDTVNYKGFDPRDRIWEMETPDIDSYTDIEPCSEKEEEYITKLIELARSEDIPIILFASPFDTNESEQAIHNYVWTIAEKEGAEYIDFNTRYDEIGMDYSCDMADTGHLNYSGNYKFTNYFGGLLKSEFDLPDRREDPRYDSWNWDSSIQKYERIDSRIISSEDAVEVLTLAQKGYIVFGISNGNAVVIDDGVSVAEGSGEFRIPYESGEDTFLFVDENEAEFDHYCSLFINDKRYRENYGNILFIYDKVRHEYVRSMEF
ncbi:MAG: hypothetical protein K5744_01430 [Eubacterium sp.]|nr:hypothetical protein [Eubacterium sp.]